MLQENIITLNQMPVAKLLNEPIASVMIWLNTKPEDIRASILNQLFHLSQRQANH
ncbi:hypothetical protein PPE03_11530 [Pseudoalteromonas peptidolytica]|nr:hypothetical protein PPE03_11530 [Pseudoalteromonas peptidolytica]